MQQTCTKLLSLFYARAHVRLASSRTRTRPALAASISPCWTRRVAVQDRPMRKSPENFAKRRAPMGKGLSLPASSQQLSATAIELVAWGAIVAEPTISAMAPITAIIRRFMETSYGRDPDSRDTSYCAKLTSGSRARL
jgi:hypothetical protein